jgi:hypothetical protein
MLTTIKDGLEFVSWNRMVVEGVNKVLGYGEVDE